MKYKLSIFVAGLVLGIIGTAGYFWWTDATCMGAATSSRTPEEGALNYAACHNNVIRMWLQDRKK